MREAREPRLVDVARLNGPAVPHHVVLRECAAQASRSDARTRVAGLTASLLAATGRGLVLDEADLAGLDLSGFDLRRASLNRARLHGARLVGADLTGASLVCPGMERTDLTGASLRRAYVHALAAQVCSFADADLSDLVDATGALFHGCKLTGARLDRAMLAGTTFYQCDLARTRWARAVLQGGTINECILDGADLEGASVGALVVTKTRMRDTKLSRVTGRGLVIQRPTASEGLVLAHADVPALRCDGLRGDLDAVGLRASSADFLDCRLARADFGASTLDGARFAGCAVEGAIFRGATLDGASFVDCRFPRAVFEAANAENARFVECTMPGSDLRRFTARCASFRDCDLEGSDLTGAYLYRSFLTGDPPRAMSLRGARLDEANVVQAYVAADLTTCSLRGANLTYARLNQSILEGADLAGVGLYEACLVKVDVTDASLAGVRAPFFADRCRGLGDALARTDAEGATRRFVGDLERLLGDLSRKGST